MSDFPHKCPRCTSFNIYIMGKVESGTHGNQEDYYVYECGDCLWNFDSFEDPAEE